MPGRSRRLLAGAMVAGLAASSTLATAQPVDLEGARAGQAEGSLMGRGYALDHNDGGAQYWWNGGRGECISLYVDNGRYRDVRGRSPSDCNMYGGGKKKKDNTGAVVAGALAIGILAAAAASSKKKHDNDRYDDYRDQKSYSPDRGVDCYPAQRACYERGSGYSAYWTKREFKYRY